MTTIPIQLTDAYIKKIDYLVKLGRYKSRNQALKKYVDEGIAREQIELEKIDLELEKKKEKIFEMLDNCDDFSFHLESGESFADQIISERDRD